MARYSSFLGQRVEVQYRASDTLLPASGVFVADSGRSIFLEQSFEQRGQHRHFRWEIPYQYLIKIGLSKGPHEPAGEPAPAEAPTETAATEPPPSASATAENLVARAAAAAGLNAVVLPIVKRSQTA